MTRLHPTIFAGAGLLFAAVFTTAIIAGAI